MRNVAKQRVRAHKEIETSVHLAQMLAQHCGHRSVGSVPQQTLTSSTFDLCFYFKCSQKHPFVCVTDVYFGTVPSGANLSGKVDLSVSIEEICIDYGSGEVLSDSRSLDPQFSLVAFTWRIIPLSELQMRCILVITSVLSRLKFLLLKFGRRCFGSALLL